MIEEQIIQIGFLKNILNSLAGKVAILDNKFKIVLINKNLVDFSLGKGIDPKINWIGKSFIRFYNEVAVDSNVKDAALYEAISKIVDGKNSTFEFKFYCQSPREKSEYKIIGNRFEYNNLNWISINYEQTDKNYTDSISTPQYEIYLNSVSSNKNSSIKKSKRKVKKVFKYPSVGIAHINLQGKFLFVNKKFQQIFGCNVTEFSKLDYKNFLFDEDIKKGQKKIKLLIEGKLDYVSIENRFVHKNGNIIWGKLIISMIKKKSEKFDYLIVVFEDISDTVRIKEEYKQLFNSSRDIIAIINLDGYPTLINAAAERIWGYDKKRIMSASFLELVHPDDHQKTMDEFDKLKRGITSINFENRYITKNGDIKYVSWNCTSSLNYNEIYAIGRDITYSKTIAKEIRESEDKYLDLLEQADDGIVLLQDGYFKYANEALSNLLGYSKEELIDTHFKNYIAPEELSKVLKFSQNRLEDEFIPTVYESRILNKAGISKAVEFNVGLTNHRGEKASLTFVRNIEKRKKIQEKLLLHGKIISNMTEAVFLTNINDGTILFSNIALEKMYKYDIGELNGKNVSVLFDTKETPFTSNTFDKNINWKGELQSIKKDKTKFWTFTSVRTFEHPSFGMVYITVQSDISNLKETEKLLKEKNLLLENTLNSLAHPFYVINVHDFSIQLANPAAKKKGLIQGITCCALSKNSEHHCNCERSICPIPELKKTKAPVLREHVYKDKYGKKVYVEVHAHPIFDKNGKLVQMIEYILDITKRKHTEKLLNESSKRLHLATEAAQIGHWEWNLKEKKIYFSPEWKRQLGFKDNEIKNSYKSWVSLVHKNDIEVSKKKIDDFISGKIKELIIEYRLKHRDGSFRWIYARAEKQVDEKGRAMKLIGCHIDITPNKNAELKILNHQHRLRDLAIELTLTEEKQRNQIATDLHDDVGQLLASTRIQLSLINKEMKMPKVLSNIKHISKGLLYAIRAIRGAIFDLSPPQLNEIGLYAATSDWLDEEVQIKYGIKTLLKGNNEIVIGDINLRVLIFRSIKELLMNSVKHSKTKELHVTFGTKDGNLRIIVEDFGCGFNYNPDMLRIKNAGFGLFSIQERMSDIGGKMSVTSTLFKGTIITLSVPIKN